MKARTVKWVVALAASGALHAGAAALLLPEMETARIAGGAPTEIAVAGNALADQISAGETADVAEPVENAAETKPAEAEITAAQAVEAASPVETAETVEAETARPSLPRQAQASPAVEIAETPVMQPAEAERAEPAEAAPVQPSAPADAAQAEKAREADVAVTPAAEGREKQPEAPQAAKAAERPETVGPAKPEERVTALADVPVPTPRPDYEPPKRAKVQRPEPREARRAPSRKAAGSGGENQADSRRGSEDGREQGKAAQQGQRIARADAAGNAAVSNYPGKVVGKLRLALRYPAKAKRSRLEGEVHVRFIISRGGGVGSIRVVRSSGSPLLDEAAVDTVRRAAPFPAIPAAAGRSSWPFTVPLAFVR